MARVLVPVFLLIALSSAPPAAAADWRWPVRGPVARGFQLGRDPFLAGQHRGIDIVAPAGRAVRAACSGPVRFAGVVGASGGTVAVVCGALTATYLHLGSLAVRTGSRVGVGDRLGTVGPADPREPVRAAHLHFGVRRTAQRFGYLDPLMLLPPPGRPTRPRPPVVIPPARVPRPATLPRPGGPPAAPARVPAEPRRVPGRHGHPSASPHPSPVGSRAPGHPSASPHPSPVGSLIVRVGLLLAVLALPAWGGAVVTGRRRRRSRTARTATAAARRIA